MTSNHNDKEVLIIAHVLGVPMEELFKDDGDPDDKN